MPAGPWETLTVITFPKNNSTIFRKNVAIEFRAQKRVVSINRYFSNEMSVINLKFEIYLLIYLQNEKKKN